MNADPEELPEGWAWTKVSDVASKVGSGATPKGGSESYHKTGIPLIRSMNVHFAGFRADRLAFLDNEQAGQLKEASVEAGDVLLNITGASIGRVCQVPVSLAGARVNQHVSIIRTIEGMLPGFLAKYISSPDVQRMIWSEEYGVTRQALTKGQILDFDIPLPPLAEQKRIVAKLETLLTRVNAARQRLAKVPALLKPFPPIRPRRRLFGTTHRGLAAGTPRCGTGINADYQDTDRAQSSCSNRLSNCEEQWKSVAEETGQPYSIRQGLIVDEPLELPDKWEWVVWNDLADWITYGFTRPMPHVARGIPIVSAKNVRDGSLQFDDIEQTTAQAFAALSEKDKPRRGEILVTKDGAIRGRAALVETDKPFCITQAVAVIRFGGMSGFAPYLLRVIQSPLTQRQIEEESSGTAIPHISITDFGRFPVPFPPLAEQHEIVRRVEALLDRAHRIEQRLAAASRRVDMLTQAILAQAFRGELVPTEAELARREGRDYEPAAVLLERIRAERQQQEKPKRAKRHSTK